MIMCVLCESTQEWTLRGKLITAVVSPFVRRVEEQMGNA